MRITKRQFIAGSVAAGVGAALIARRAGAPGPAGRQPSLAVYDGSNPAGRRFAARAREAGIRTVDLAADAEGFWRDARGGFGLAEGAELIGVTGWDERVYLAAALRDRRMRVRQEKKLDDRMFEWRIG